MPLELGLKQVSRLYLQSHFLLNRTRPAHLLRVVADVCGLNAQTARAPYISLWSRIEEFEKELFDKALYQDKVLIKMWLMRGTVHIIPARQFVIFQKALGRQLVEDWLRQLSQRGLMLSASRRTKLHRKILDALAQGPRTKRELLPEIGPLLRDHVEREQKARLGWILRELSYRGLVCHGEPTGPWYHFKEHHFALVEHWLQGRDLDALDEGQARDELLIKYLHGYGPASVQDFAHWTGLKMTASKKIFDHVKTRLAEVKTEHGSRSLWMLPEDLARLEDIDLKQKFPVRFLPEFDSMVMGHKDKSRLLDEGHRKKVFLPLADVAPVVLVNGRIAGAWKFTMAAKSLACSLFQALRPQERRALEVESKRLCDFLKAK